MLTSSSSLLLTKKIMVHDDPPSRLPPEIFNMIFDQMCWKLEWARQ
jgi:hypothetical protein